METAGPGLIGRDEEVARLTAGLEGASEHGAAVLIRGAAGIGKTSLIAAALADARLRGYRVLTMTGIESEAQLPYAGLHQLLHPVIAQIETLAPPQQTALKTALGMTAADAPEIFLVALAALNLIDAFAGDGPMVIAADDVQWLDGPTTAVLTFIARRVEPTRMVVMATIRDGYDSLLIAARVPELRIEPLSDVASAELLDAVAPRLPRRLRQRVLDEALGNPLALIELPRALNRRRTRAEEGLPLTDRLERAFSALAAPLPEATRTALLLAAVDDSPRLSEVLDAARVLMKTDISMDVMAPAFDAGLIVLEDSRIRFRHPLIRSAVEQAAAPGRLREAHRAMAAVIVDPDRRAWHRAASVLGTDDEVADELEATASRAQDRGATAIALRALELAATRTPDGTLRSRRLLAAAEVAFQLGQPAAVGRLLEGAAKLPLSPNDVARMAWVREIFSEGVPGDPGPIVALVTIAKETAARGDQALALNLLQAAARRCYWADPGPKARELVVQALDQIDADATDPRALEILSLSSPVDDGGRVSRLVAEAALAEDLEPSRIEVLGFAAGAAGDFEQALSLLNRAAPGLRAEGRIGLVVQLLIARAFYELIVGRFPDAHQDAEEGFRLAVETEQFIYVAGSSVGRALLAGVRGEEALAERLATEAEAAILSLRLSPLLAEVQLARGLAAMTAGRHSDAFEHFARMFDPRDVAFNELESFSAVGFVIECAVRAERDEEARELMVRIEALGRRTPAARLHVGLRFARAVLADDPEAEAVYEVALAAEPKWPFDYARLQMAYGRWLRRQRRIIESRPYLRAARDTFETLGVHPWANMARAELRASGERIARAARAPKVTLSPQELQVAQMAASGLSNREIGDRLFLSHRTVGAHLYRAYPKLGIASRSELARALAALEPSPSQ